MHNICQNTVKSLSNWINEWPQVNYLCLLLFQCAGLFNMYGWQKLSWYLKKNGLSAHEYKRWNVAYMCKKQWSDLCVCVCVFEEATQFASAYMRLELCPESTYQVTHTHGPQLGRDLAGEIPGAVGWLIEHSSLIVWSSEMGSAWKSIPSGHRELVVCVFGHVWFSQLL